MSEPIECAKTYFRSVQKPMREPQLVLNDSKTAVVRRSVPQRFLNEYKTVSGNYATSLSVVFARSWKFACARSKHSLLGKRSRRSSTKLLQKLMKSPRVQPRAWTNSLAEARRSFCRSWWSLQFCLPRRFVHGNKQPPRVQQDLHQASQLSIYYHRIKTTY